MKCTRVSTSLGIVSSAFAAGAVDEPAAGGGENTVRGEFLVVLGGADMVCWGAGTEGDSELCCLASDRTLSRKWLSDGTSSECGHLALEWLNNALDTVFGLAALGRANSNLSTIELAISSRPITAHNSTFS